MQETDAVKLADYKIGKRLFKFCLAVLGLFRNNQILCRKFSINPNYSLPQLCITYLAISTSLLWSGGPALLWWDILEEISFSLSSKCRLLAQDLDPCKLRHTATINNVHFIFIYFNYAVTMKLKCIKILELG